MKRLCTAVFHLYISPCLRQSVFFFPLLCVGSRVFMGSLWSWFVPHDLMIFPLFLDFWYLLVEFLLPIYCCQPFYCLHFTFWILDWFLALIIKASTCLLLCLCLCLFYVELWHYLWRSRTEILHINVKFYKVQELLISNHLLTIHCRW